MDKKLEYARRWFDKAKSDLLNADNNLIADKVPYDTVCFHCQQAAEKILKAYLVAKGMQPRFTHDLLLLLEGTLFCCADAESLRDDLALLMPYAVEVRYPDDLFVPTHEEAIEARQAAEHVLEWFQLHFEGLFP